MDDRVTLVLFVASLAAPLVLAWGVVRRIRSRGSHPRKGRWQLVVGSLLCLVALIFLGLARLGDLAYLERMEGSRFEPSPLVLPIVTLLYVPSALIAAIWVSVAARTHKKRLAKRPEFPKATARP